MAMEDIKAGTFVTDYRGEVISRKLVDRSWFESH